MRFVWIIMIIVILAFSFSGCKEDETTNKANNEASTIAKTAETSGNDSSTSSSDESNKQEEVVIKPSNEKPLSLSDKNTIFLEGLLKGEEYIEVIVTGEIFDFEQISLTWDEAKNELKEKETVKKIDKLADQTLVLKTYQPEGIPTEKIKWKSRTGKTYEYIIEAKSLGDTDDNITKFEII